MEPNNVNCESNLGIESGREVNEHEETQQSTLQVDEQTQQSTSQVPSEPKVPFNFEIESEIGVDEHEQTHQNTPQVDEHEQTQQSTSQVPSEPEVPFDWKKILGAEFLGAFLTVCIGWGAIVLVKDLHLNAYPILMLPLALTAVVMLALHPISSIFMPAVAITLAIHNQLDWSKVAAYILAEVLGSFCAISIWNLSFIPFNHKIPQVLTHLTFIIETIICLAFVLFIFGFYFDEDERAHTPLSAIILTIIILANMSTAPLERSGNIKMTAREAAIKSLFEGFCVYIIAPVIGCTLGSLIFVMVKHLHSNPNSSSVPEGSRSQEEV